MRRHHFRNHDWNDPQWKENMQQFQADRQKGKVMFGIGVALAGAIWLVGTIVHYNFDWEYNWPFFVIGIGILIGLKNNFRNSAWWILVLIGAANLVQIHFPKFENYLWPSVMLAAGLFIAFRPRRKYCYDKNNISGTVNPNNTFNLDVTFGGRKEMITAKDFKGGATTVTFGGCELNFMQCEMAEDTAVLDVKVAFGGLEIIIPSNWHILNEVSPSFGNVEDERSIQPTINSENRKTLILRGTCSFGAVEIKSY